MNILLQGIGGSVAHGLAGPGSDEDRYGVYAAPTLDLVVPLSEQHKATIRDEDGNVVLWEAGHFASLLLACNPTAMEMLWLPDELYEVETPYGRWLRDLRTDVLAVALIRERYSSMVLHQRRDLIRERRKPQAAKLVRHGLRVAEQGMVLMWTGNLPVQVRDPVQLRRYDDNPWSAFDELERQAVVLRNALSETMPLQQEPAAREAVRSWVRSVRLGHLT